MSRSDKVAQEIKKVVSAVIQKELFDPRMGFTTITRVEVTDDLRFSHIYYSVLGDEQQWQNTGEAVEHAAAFIRCRLGDELNLRYVPEIVFRPDHSVEYSIRIEQELERIRREREGRTPERPKRHKGQKGQKRHGAKKTGKRAKR